MFTLMIIDDEITFRNFINKILPTKEIGIENVVSFSNGHDALNYIRQNDVHIVLTDIKMPIMDGVEFIRRAKEISPSIAFIVLSAYDDFTYVKQCFKLGVSDYFLKSELTRDALKSSIANITYNISGASKSLKIHPADRYASDNSSVVKKTCVGDMLHKMIFDADYVFNPSDFKNLCDAKSYQVIISRLHIYQNTKVCLGEARLNSLIINISDEINIFLNNNNIGCAFPDLHSPAICTLTTNPQKTHDILDFITHLFLQKYNIEFSGGTSSIFTAFKDFKDYYYQSLRSVEAAVFYPKNQFIAYSIVKRDLCSTKSIDFDSKIAIFESFLETLSHDNVLIYINDLYISPYEISVSDFKKLYKTYYSIILSYCNKKNISEKLEDELNSYVYDLSAYGNIDELTLWLKNVLLKISFLLSEDSYIFNQIKEYIASNYDKNITLSSISKKFNMNSSYISRMFRKYFGVNFLDYLTNIRMDSACFYLLNTDLKIYEISAKLGYNNSASFTNNFKNYKNCTPEEYRLNNQSR